MKPLLMVLGLVLLASPTAAQFLVGDAAVSLDVSVVRDDRPVAGLTAADFVVTDNGALQEIASVSPPRDHTLSVVLVLDSSGSISGQRRTHLIEAAQGLLATLGPGDRAGLITFSSAVDVRVGLTTDLARVGAAVAAIQGIGTSSVRDAIQVAVELVAADGTRPFVLVFTDGRDTMSWLTDAEVTDAVRRAGVVVHMVHARGLDARPQIFERLADDTGGRLWSVSSDRDLPRAFARAIDEMRGRYVLTLPTQDQATPGWHELKVRLKQGRADVRARAGYYVNDSR